MPNEETPAGEMKWVPTGAVVVYPTSLVHELLGYSYEGSTRKEMSRRGVRAVHGYPAEAVDRAIVDWNPERAWPRTKGARTRT